MSLPLKVTVPVATVGTSPFVLIGKTALPAGTAAELIQHILGVGRPQQPPAIFRVDADAVDVVDLGIGVDEVLVDVQVSPGRGLDLKVLVLLADDHAVVRTDDRSVADELHRRHRVRGATCVLQHGGEHPARRDHGDGARALRDLDEARHGEAEQQDGDARGALASREHRLDRRPDLRRLERRAEGAARGGDEDDGKLRGAGLLPDRLENIQPARARHRHVHHDDVGVDLRHPHECLGAVGSAKLSAAEIKSIEDKIITIEDPVEYQLSGITQIPINEKKGLTFARGLRSILRHDPDKIMVGEIRDPETAQIAIQSALTGHLVFTTVHANNVFDVLGRFLNMGVEPYQFISALNCVMAQRLARADVGIVETEDYARKRRSGEIGVGKGGMFSGNGDKRGGEGESFLHEPLMPDGR